MRNGFQDDLFQKVERDLMKDRFNQPVVKRTVGWVISFFVAWVLFYFTVIGLLVYGAVHFIAKFW